MNLLAHHRRYMGILVLAIFGLTFLSNLIPDPLARWEVRTVIIPTWSWAEKAHTAIRNTGAYMQDNFGFRASMPTWRRAVREAFDSPDTRPFYTGRDGQLFWGREETPEQSSGALVRRAAVQRFVFMVGEMQRVLEPLGTKIVVTIPPNAQSVELEALPAWNDLLDYPNTEAGLAMDGLVSEGIAVVDLRKALREAPRPRYLMTDTHWNFRTSILGFNAVMRGAGHPDWQVDLKEVLGPLQPAPRGDILQAMRMPPQVKEENFELRIKDRSSKPRLDPALKHHNEHFAFISTVRDYAPTGPRVLIMGDSFSAFLWQRLFINAPVSVVGWMHGSRRVTGSCDFNFNDVKAFKPDLLIIARAERFFPCRRADDWPTGLPKPWPGAIPRDAAP